MGIQVRLVGLQGLGMVTLEQSYGVRSRRINVYLLVLIGGMVLHVFSLLRRQYLNGKLLLLWVTEKTFCCSMVYMHERVLQSRSFLPPAALSVDTIKDRRIARASRSCHILTLGFSIRCFAPENYQCTKHCVNYNTHRPNHAC